MKTGTTSPLFTRVLLLAIFGISILAFASVPYAHGTNAVVTAGIVQNSCTASNAVCTTGSINTVANSVLIISVNAQGASGGHSRGIQVSSITDTQSNSYLLGAQQMKLVEPTGYGSFDAEVWYATVGTTGSATITVTLNATYWAIYGISVIDVSGIASAPSGTSGNGCYVSGGPCSSTAINTAANIPYATGDLLVGSIVTEDQVVITATFSQFTTHTCDGTSVNFCAEYLVAPSASSTNFGTSQGACVSNTCFYSIVGLDFPVSGGSGPPTGSTTLGSCPTKNTSTQTLANGTIYFYNAAFFNNQVVQTITVSVASVTSGTHYLRLLIYAQPAPGQTTSPLYPITLQFQSQAFQVTSATKNQIISVNVGTKLPQFASTDWSVGVIGDDHIKLNQSSLSGMTTQTGNTPVQSASQPSSFTNLGSASAVQLYLCATANFQSIVTQTSTSIVTVIGTSTATVTSLNTDTVAGTLPAFVLDIIVIIGPSILIAGLTKSLWGGILGAMLGLAVAVLIGIAPFWLIVAEVLAVVGMLFFARPQAAGGV